MATFVEKLIGGNENKEKGMMRSITFLKAGDTINILRGRIRI